MALLLRDSEGRPPELPAIAFALLSALRALAAEAPVLLAIDDAQWLDEPSAAALQFALRRVAAAGCPALVAVRSTPRERAPLELERLPPSALTRLRLTGLRVGVVYARGTARLRNGRFVRVHLKRLRLIYAGRYRLTLRLRSPGSVIRISRPVRVHRRA